jgi:hypothetical protein
MRVINTIDRPKISLKRKPPHKVSKNTLSDLFKLNFMNNMPIVKLNVEKPAPSKIESNIRSESSEIR